VSTLGRLFLLFTLVPLIELWLLVQIGGVIGALPTIAIVAATGMTGAWLVRREGRKALADYQKAVAEARLPEDGIVSGLLILLGGILLIAPGILTDLTGMALMIPPVRRAVARRLEQRLQAKLVQGVATGNVRVISFGGASPFAGADPFGGAPPTGSTGSIIDVEAHESSATPNPGDLRRP
jgi:UPF0716 protein FxsA